MVFVIVKLPAACAPVPKCGPQQESAATRTFRLRLFVGAVLVDRVRLTGEAAVARAADRSERIVGGP